MPKNPTLGTFCKPKIIQLTTKFDEIENEAKILNNLGVSFYTIGDKKNARRFFQHGMEVNNTISHPDPIIIYNYLLMEQSLRSMEEEISIKALMRCRESPERNLLIFILRLKQAKFMNVKFFAFRQFNEDFFRNEALGVLLTDAHQYIKENPMVVEHRSQLIALKTIEPLGTVLSRYVCPYFCCCLVVIDEELQLAVWSLGENSTHTSNVVRRKSIFFIYTFRLLRKR